MTNLSPNLGPYGAITIIPQWLGNSTILVNRSLKDFHQHRVLLPYFNVHMFVIPDRKLHFWSPFKKSSNFSMSGWSNSCIIPGWSTFLSDCNSTLLQLDLSHVCILHLLPLVVVSHLWNVRLLWSCLTWSKTTKQTHWFVKRKIVPTFLLKKSSLHLSLWWKTLWYYHNDFHPKGIKLC